MRNHLAGFSARGAEAHAVNHVVQTGFKKGEKVFTSVAGDTFSFREVTTELTFENAIKTLGLLRFAHLSAVVGRAGSGNLTVLARLGTDVLDLGLKRTTGALQIKINAFATRKLELRTEISCHLKLPLLSCRYPYIQSTCLSMHVDTGFNRKMKN